MRNIIGEIFIVCCFFIACETIPPQKSSAPQGKGWITYSQSYNSSYTTQTSSGGGNFTSSTNYESKILKGTSIISEDSISCAGFKYIKDCNKVFIKK